MATNPLGTLMSGGTMSKAMTTILQIGGVLIIAFVIGIIFYLIIYFINFNKKILLIEEVGGGGLRFAFDKGRRDLKKKEFKALRFRNYQYAYPKSTDEYPIGMGTIIPFIVKNGQAVPIKGIADNPHFIPADINMFNHLVARIMQNNELTKRKETWWDRYGKDIMWGTMITIFLLSIIFILKRVDRAIDMGHSIISMANSQQRQVLSYVSLIMLWRRKDEE